MNAGKSLICSIHISKPLVLSLCILFLLISPDTVAGQNGVDLTIVGSVATPGDAKGVYVSGNYAYVAADDEGLQVIKIIDPKKPAIVGALKMQNSGRAWFVHVLDSYACIVSDCGGSFSLEMIDISDPEHPESVGYFGTQGSPQDLHISGNHAYVVWQTLTATGSQGGLKIIDISNPEHPAKAEYKGTGKGAQGVYASGNYAYVADGGWEGLLIFNVSNPENPMRISTLSVADAAKVCVSGKYAYVAGANDLHVLDISDHLNPQIIGSVERSTGAQGMYITGLYAYIAAYDNGIDIVNITDPQNPSLITSVNTPGKAADVFVSGSYAYVADNEGGLKIIDLSDLSTLPDGGDGSDQTGDGGGNGTDAEADKGGCFVASSSQGSLSF